MSVVSTPRPSSTAISSAAEVLPDRSDHPHLGEEARREREVHGRAPEHPLPLAERGAHGIEGDRADDGQRHGRAAYPPAALKHSAAMQSGADHRVRRPRGAPARPRFQTPSGGGPDPGQRRAVRGQLRRHPRHPQRLPGRPAAAADPGRRDRGHDARRPPRRGAADERRLRRAGRRARRGAGPGARRGRRRPGSGAAAAGPDRVQHPPHLGPPAGRARASSIARRRRRHRQPRGPARQAAWARAG